MHTVFSTAMITNLPGRRSDSRNDIVVKDLGIVREEFKDDREVARKDEARRRDANGRHIDSEHHLKGVHIFFSIVGVDS